MLTLPLEPTDDRANPLFKDVKSCTRWLGQFQLTDVSGAHATLLTQLNEMNRFPMRGLDRWHILEQLRETVYAVQAEYAKKLLGKKLPLNDKEFMIFVALNTLEQQMVIGYQRCLQALFAGDSRLDVVALCQRCMHYTHRQIFTYLHTGYEVSGKLWQQLHTLYAFSEEQEFQTQAVQDYDEKNKNHNAKHQSAKYQTSCHAIYVQTLLIAYARPQELTRKQSYLLERWLAQWSTSITVAHTATVSRGDALPRVVDLSGAKGLQAINQAEQSTHLRYLAMMPMSKLLRVKTILLQQGQSPKQVELSDVGSDIDCVELLNFLHQCWCERSGEDSPTHSGIAHQAHVCYGLEDIYAHIANKPFKVSTRSVNTMDTITRKRIATLGHAGTEAGYGGAANFGQPLEAYEIIETSVLGAYLLRKSADGVRLSRNQIVATRTGTSGNFKVGVISGVMVLNTGQLSLRVRYLPGVAQAVTLDSKGARAVGAKKPAAAILLSALAEVGIPASLLIPREWLLLGVTQETGQQEITQQDNQKISVKLGFSVEKGADFERVSFTMSPNR